MLKNAIWLFAFTVILLLAFLPSLNQMQELKAKNVELATRIEALKKRNIRLEEEKHLLETDPVYFEKVARKKMGLIRNGEKVYRIVPEVKGAVK